MGALDEIIEKLNLLPQKEREALTRQALQQTQGLKWVPNPGPQTEAYYTDADELFYGGQAGGGKSALSCGLAVTAHERSLILRRINKDAKKLAEAELLGRILDGDRSNWNGTDLIYRSGTKVIEFGGCETEQDKQRYKGDPHDLIVFDEVTDFLETQYIFICIWNRTTKPGQRCRIVCTGNPPTQATGLWVIKRWAAWLDPRHPNPAKPGELRWYISDKEGNDVEVDGKGPHLVDGKEVYAKSRTFIPAKLSDNPDLAADGEYERILDSLPKELRDAYRDGRFDASLKDAPYQCIPTAWVRAAQERWTPTPPRDVPMCAIGVDASGGGNDPMVLAKRYDGWYAPMVVIPGKDIPMDSAGAHSAGLVVSHRLDNATVVVDMGGGYGGPMYEHLKLNEIEVYAYKGSEATTKRSRDGTLKFTNKRSAAYWLFREALEPDQPGGSPIALDPDDAELCADLTAPTFSVTPNGIKLETKEDVCDRLGRSTDRGDAVIMAWFDGAKSTTHALDWLERKQRRVSNPKIIMARTPLTARRR